MNKSRKGTPVGTGVFVFLCRSALAYIVCNQEKTPFRFDRRFPFEWIVFLMVLLYNGYSI